MTASIPDNDSDQARGGVSLLRDILSLQWGVRALASDQARLASLEARQGVTSLVKIMALTLAGGIAALAAWLSVMALILLALTGNDVMSLAGGLLLLLVGNVVITLLLCVGIYRLSRHLRFRATLNSLKRQLRDNGDRP